MTAHRRLHVGHLRAVQSLGRVLAGPQLECARDPLPQAHLDDAHDRAVGQGRAPFQVGDDPQCRRPKVRHMCHRGRLVASQSRSPLEVVEYVVQPGVVELVGDDVPDVEQAQPAPVRDGRQVLPQPAVHRDLVSWQECPLECDVARQR